MKKIENIHFNCNCCNELYPVEVGHYAKAHNTYGYVCPTCWNNGVIATEGIACNNVEKHTELKKAGHGVVTRIMVEVPVKDIETRAWLYGTYSVARLGNKYLTFGKEGTWQLSKVTKELRERGYEPVAFFHYHDRDSKYDYDYDLAYTTPETVITLTRKISSMHYLPKKAVEEYGITVKKYER